MKFVHHLISLSEICPPKLKDRNPKLAPLKHLLPNFGRRVSLNDFARLWKSDITIFTALWVFDVTSPLIAPPWTRWCPRQRRNRHRSRFANIGCDHINARAQNAPASINLVGCLSLVMAIPLNDGPVCAGIQFLWDAGDVSVHGIST